MPKLATLAVSKGVPRLVTIAHSDRDGCTAKREVALNKALACSSGVAAACATVGMSPKTGHSSPIFEPRRSTAVERARTFFFGAVYRGDAVRPRAVMRGLHRGTPHLSTFSTSSALVSRIASNGVPGLAQCSDPRWPQKGQPAHAGGAIAT